LLPEFMSALPYLFFSWLVHGSSLSTASSRGFRGNRGEGRACRYQISDATR
jgi:hypothetical protein